MSLSGIENCQLGTLELDERRGCPEIFFSETGPL